MVRGAALAAVLVWVVAASPGHGQDSTTTCNSVFNTVHCTTTNPPSGGAAGGFAGGFARGLESNGGLAAAIERHRQLRAERARQSRYSEAGKLIAAGKCADARVLALNAGDFELAQRVASQCPPPAAQ